MQKISYLVTKRKNEKIDDSLFDYGEFEDKFITTFGLKDEIKTQIKFYINGEEINKDDKLMDIVRYCWNQKYKRRR